ncbi:MAG: hypothetical protein JXR96_21885 [Deltaproteobacteria bacterium]|nr:hypothetical protein [Deltaproteobacteria bacterium]
MSRTAVKLCLPAFLALAASGCSGGCLMPYVSIPARVEIGGVSAHGNVPSQRESGAVVESSFAEMLHLRAGIHPMQAFNGWHGRSWDIGGGYLFEHLWPEGEDPLPLHGFYLEGSWFPVAPAADASGLRLGLVADAEIIMDSFHEGAELGPGGSLGLTLEWSGTASTTYAGSTGGGLGSSAGSVGALYGEWGVGLAASLGYRRLWGMDFMTVMVGLSFRLPFGAGLFGLSS